MPYKNNDQQHNMKVYNKLLEKVNSIEIIDSKNSEDINKIIQAYKARLAVYRSHISEGYIPEDIYNEIMNEIENIESEIAKRESFQAAMQKRQFSNRRRQILNEEIEEPVQEEPEAKVEEPAQEEPEVKVEEPVQKEPEVKVEEPVQEEEIKVEEPTQVEQETDVTEPTKEAEEVAEKKIATSIDLDSVIHMGVNSKLRDIINKPSTIPNGQKMNRAQRRQQEKEDRLEKSKAKMEERKRAEQARRKAEKEEEKAKKFKVPDMPETDFDLKDVNFKDELMKYEDEIESDYLDRKQDMMDKYYGNKDKAKEYKERIARYKSHLKQMTFEIFEAGGRKTGRYSTIEDYPELAEDVKFLQLEEYKERLERFTKYQAGDKNAYKDCKNPDIVRKEDEVYIQTNNGAYNRKTSVQKSLVTLGNFGDKVPYIPMGKSKLPVKAVKGVLNGLLFVRNHITAPIYKFVGSKIVAPIHRKIFKPDEKAASPYESNWTHRYEARKTYFKDQGKGFFRQRINAVLKYKEGNEAILAAGGHDIFKSISRQYVNKAIKNIKIDKINESSEKLNEQIKELNEKISSLSEKQRAKREIYEKAVKEREEQLQINNDELKKLQKQKDTSIVQTDAIDMKTHEMRDKKNVTRAVTIVKAITIAGAKYIGPKIKHYIIGKTKKQEVYTWTDKKGDQVATSRQWVDETTKTTQKTTQEWVDPTYKYEKVTVYKDAIDTSKNMEDIIGVNSGSKVTGYYSVYGGEKGSNIYELTGNEKITAIFEAKGNGGVGLADKAGLTAPTLTNDTFASDLLDSSGVLNQNTTLEDLLKAISNGSVDKSSLDDMYVSISDKYWTKLSDLVKDMTTKVPAGEEMKKVVDVAGHYEEVVKDVVEKIPGHWETVSTVIPGEEILHTGTKVVENEMVGKILEHLSKIGNGIVAADVADMVYENARKPKVKQVDNKETVTEEIISEGTEHDKIVEESNSGRRYDFDDTTEEGFAKPKKAKKEKQDKSKEDEEGR